MDVYDTANKLAHELKNSKEYLEFKKAKEELDQNLNLKDKISQFEKLRYEIQVFSLKGEKQDKEKVENMQKLYLDLIKEEKVKNYFDLELKFNVLLADVNKIIGESIQDVLK